MKGTMITLMTILTASILFLSVPAMGQKMKGMGPGDGMEGPGPMNGQDSRKGPLDKGVSYRYGNERPAASIENEGGNSGIMISIGRIRHDDNGTSCEIDPGSSEWTVDQEDGPSGTNIGYQGQLNWKDENNFTCNTSRISISFRYRWEGEKKDLEVNILIEDPPSKGNLTIDLELSSIGLDDGCCWKGQENGHRFQYQNNEGADLGEFMIDGDANISTSGGQKTVETDVLLESDEETGTLSISSTIGEDIDSYSVSGSFLVLEGLVKALDQAAEDTVSFILDHIVSFAIGTALVIFVLIISIAYLSRKNVRTNGQDLMLENNRFYRND
jgi:hypothetical protein